MTKPGPRDMRAAWSIYRGSGYSLSLEEINDRLIASNFRPVAQRSYDHFRRLRRHGYERYVPINQLDVAVVRDPVWDSPVRNLYRLRSTQVACRLILERDNEIVSISGVVDSISESDATFHVIGLEESTRLITPKPVDGLQGILAVLDDQRNPVISQPCEVEVVRSEPPHEMANVQVTFLVPASVENVGNRTSIETTKLRVSLQASDDGLLVNSVRYLFWIFDAIETARIVCDEALAQIDQHGRYVSPTPVIDRLEKGSPLYAEMTISIPTAVFFMFTFIELKRRLHRADAEAGRAAQEHAKADVISEVARRFRLQSDQQEQVNSFLETGQIEKFAVSTLLQQIGSPREAELDLGRARSLIEHQLLPAIVKLFDPAVQSLDISSDSEPSREEGPTAASEDTEPLA